MASAKVRLYVDQPLGPDNSVVIGAEQSHYLFNVMRLGAGGFVALFNGRDGEWTAEIAEAQKRQGRLRCVRQTGPQKMPPDLWLLFAPIKKARTDFIVEKATELGVSRICPVQTDYTNAERIRLDRLRAHAVEAAEQCGGTFVPEVAPMVKLEGLLSQWATERRILFCDEARAGAPTNALDDLPRGAWAVLVGPEGGFSDAERNRLGGMAAAHTVSLGPRVLRADTAAVAALTLWQDALGDWR